MTRRHTIGQRSDAMAPCPGGYAMPLAGGGERAATSAACEDVRPTVCGALFSLTVAPTWTAALLLFACLWLPQFTGCDGVDVRPIDRLAAAADAEQQLTAVCLLWPHWFGLLTGVGLIVVSFVRPSDPGRWLLIAPSLIWVGLLLAFGILGLLHPPSGSQQWLELLLVLPVAVAPGAWALFAARRRHWLAAWARLTSALAVLAVPSLLLGTFPSQGSLYGLTVALVAAASLAPWVWILRWRGRRTLVDRRAPTEPIRFGTGQLMVYTTFVAATLGYYRVMPWLIEQAERQ